MAKKSLLAMSDGGNAELSKRREQLLSDRGIGLSASTSIVDNTYLGHMQKIIVRKDFSLYSSE